jgi:hypothetical protein
VRPNSRRLVSILGDERVSEMVGHEKIQCLTVCSLVNRVSICEFKGRD